MAGFEEVVGKVVKRKSENTIDFDYCSGGAMALTQEGKYIHWLPFGRFHILNDFIQNPNITDYHLLLEELITREDLKIVNEKDFQFSDFVADGVLRITPVEMAIWETGIRNNCSELLHGLVSIENDLKNKIDTYDIKEMIGKMQKIDSFEVFMQFVFKESENLRYMIFSSLPRGVRESETRMPDIYETLTNVYRRLRDSVQKERYVVSLDNRLKSSQLIRVVDANVVAGIDLPSKYSDVTLVYNEAELSLLKTAGLECLNIIYLGNQNQNTAGLISALSEKNLVIAEKLDSPAEYATWLQKNNKIPIS